MKQQARFAVLVLAFGLLAGACSRAPKETPPPEPGTRMEILSPSDDHQHAVCTDDGVWCLSDTSDGVVRVTRYEGKGASVVAALPAKSDNEHITFAPWRRIVREYAADGSELVVVGVAGNEYISYSGGGGQIVRLALYVLSPTPIALTPEPAYLVPLSSALSIRACFTPEDAERRLNACNDQYEFAGDVSLDEEAANDPLALVVTTNAETYPGVRSRDHDSTEDPPLLPGDLKNAKNEQCSYRLVLHYDVQTREYTPDHTPPACEDFLDP